MSWYYIRILLHQGLSAGHIMGPPLCGLCGWPLSQSLEDPVPTVNRTRSCIWAVSGRPWMSTHSPCQPRRTRLPAVQYQFPASRTVIELFLFWGQLILNIGLMVIILASHFSGPLWLTIWLGLYYTYFDKLTMPQTEERYATKDNQFHGTKILF